jgi:Zn-dependent alcohol dehydrogenase
MFHLQATTDTKMSLPKIYMQATLKEAGAPLIVEEVELTPPGKGEVLVKVEACGV